jgi:Flp pilus assembly protein CpaB
MRGLVAGLAVGLAVLGCVGGAGSYVFIKHTEGKVRRGWNLVPVIVYSKDLAAGDKVTFDTVLQRAIPEQFVTSSVVKPDSVSYLVNQRLLMPVKEGDPALWSNFDVMDPKLGQEAVAACRAAYPPAGRPVRSPEEIRASLVQP